MFLNLSVVIGAAHDARRGQGVRHGAIAQPGGRS